MLEWMACLALSPAIFREVSALPKELLGRFDETETLLFETLTAYFDLWEALPDPEYLIYLLKERILTREADQQMQLAQVVSRLIASLRPLKLVEDPLLEASGRKLLRERLDQLEAANLLSNLQKDEMTVRELIAEAAANLLTIAGTEADRFRSPLDAGVELEDVNFMSTGIPFIDKFCDGGLAGGEVVGHSAPIGQGKTTLCLQVMWSRAMSLVGQHMGQNVPFEAMPFHEIPVVYGFFYEPVVNLMSNFVSNAAGIHRDVMNTFFKERDKRTFSSSVDGLRNYKPYEIQQFGSQIERARQGVSPWPNGELERYEWVAKVGNKLLRFADFSGANRDVADWAEQGVDGIKVFIDTHQQRFKAGGVAMVVVDYVGALIDVWARSGGPRTKNKNRNDLIRDVVSELTNNIAAPFKCPVWAAHQLNSSENKKYGGDTPDANANEGTGMFLERCAIGFASSVLNSENVAVFVHAKQRRHVKTPPKCCQLGRDFARWSDVADKYSIVEGRVMSKDEQNSDGRGKVPSGGGFVPLAASFTGGFKA